MLHVLKFSHRPWLFYFTFPHSSSSLFFGLGSFCWHISKLIDSLAMFNLLISSIKGFLYLWNNDFVVYNSISFGSFLNTILLHFYFIFYCCFSYSCPIFPHYSPLPYPLPTSHIEPSPSNCLCPWVHYTCSFTWPFHFFPLLVSVSLFFISMSLVIFCLLVCFADYVPLIGHIIWYLSFSTWLISLSIMLSISIYDVAKDRSSFFLSAM